MKIESINCLKVQAENEKLVLVLSGTTFDEIEQKLVGKQELSVYTDNEEGERQLVEKHYDYAKADSCRYSYEQQTFTLTLRKLSSVEKELEEMKATLKALMQANITA